MRESPSRRWTFISLASLLFYGWWDWRFVFLLIGTALTDFSTALALIRFPRLRRFFLTFSIIVNIGALCLFKYSLFFAHILDITFLKAGLHARFVAEIPDFVSVLPIGISFYTFQSLSYTVDVYRGELRPTKNFLHFFSSISLFPHLVAGPIIRASDMLPQLLKATPLTEKDRWEGIVLIVGGFFKKCVLADNFAPVVTAAFSQGASVTSSQWWVVMILFSFQIYYDFSGYTDIARGLARLMGYHFVLNFNIPYASFSLREFWTRWHISLSNWFRDYVYKPLGGNRRGRFRSYLNLWITLLLSSLWHGAAFTFLAWGAWHACWLSLEKLTNWPGRLRYFGCGRLLAWLTTFLIVTLGWVFFRAPNILEATSILRRLFQHSDKGLQLPLLPLLMLFVAIAWEAGAFWYANKSTAANALWTQPLAGLAVAGAAAAAIFLRGPGSVFIYFQF